MTARRKNARHPVHTPDDAVEATVQAIDAMTIDELRAEWRAVIGERVRDKIAASKRKGMWMGGYAPLGYRAKDKKLVVEPDEATRVRQIFAEYLRLGSVAELAAFLGAEGVGPRCADAQKSEGRVPRFGVGALFHLLQPHLCRRSRLSRRSLFRRA